MPDLTAEIQRVAAEPASGAGDGWSGTNHNLKDLIEADKYLKGITATPPGDPARTPFGMIGFVRFKPLGAVQ